MGKSDSNVVPVACGGELESVSSSVRCFQSQKESAVMTASLVPIFQPRLQLSLVPAHGNISSRQCPGLQERGAGRDPHKPIA